MTEVTRVPIQPIAKGSLTKLWIGVIIAILIGAGVAWAARPMGVSWESLTSGNREDVSVKTLIEGVGPNPSETDVAFIIYKGTLASTGEVFDQTQEPPYPPEIARILPRGNPLPLNGMIPGFTKAVTQMQKGGKYEVFIPSAQGYGSNPPQGAPIPPDADLLFEIELIDFMTEQDARNLFARAEAVFNASQGGAPQGAPQPAPQPAQ